MKAEKQIRLAMLFFLAGVGLWPGLAAASMIKLSLEYLAREADTIIVGTVVGQASAWNPQRTAIHTDVTVAVEETLKGAPEGELTLRIAGGVVDDITMRTSNDPVFQDGEQVVLFLDTGSVPASIVGLRQGKHRVKRGRVKWDGRALAAAEFLDDIRDAIAGK